MYFTMILYVILLSSTLFDNDCLTNFFFTPREIFIEIVRACSIFCTGKINKNVYNTFKLKLYYNRAQAHFRSTL